VQLHSIVQERIKPKPHKGLSGAFRGAVKFRTRGEVMVFAMNTMASRRGRIDEIENIETLDLAKLYGNPFPSNDFIKGGLRPGPAYFRTAIEKWGFRDLGTIADIGSGYGRWSVFLAEANPQVVGFERNKDAVALSEKLASYLGLDNAKFVVTNTTKLPAEPASFDGAWCYNALQFMPREQVMREIHRILKPGGKLFLGVFNAEGRVLEKFFEGYAAGGLAHEKTKFAIRSLRQGAAFNGMPNYGSVDTVHRMLAEFGFEMCAEPALDLEWSRKQVQTEAYAEELKDLSALAARLESDEGFAHEFARHGALAYLLPMNLNFCAIKRS